jgi:hypothetical protein
MLKYANLVEPAWVRSISIMPSLAYSYSRSIEIWNVKYIYHRCKDDNHSNHTTGDIVDRLLIFSLLFVKGRSHMYYMIKKERIKRRLKEKKGKRLLS